MKKQVLTVFVLIMILSSIAFAQQTSQDSSVYGRLKIDVSVDDNSSSQLPNLIVQKMDLREAQNTLPALFANASEYNCSSDESGSFRYADSYADAITCLVNVSMTADISATDVDLDFMSRDEAEQSVIQFLQDNFNISTKVYKTSAITRTDYERLYEENREWLEKDLAEGGKMGATEFVEWQDEDVCYIIYLFQTEHNIPFFARGNTAFANDAVLPYCNSCTGISAMVFSDGLHYLDIENAWMVTGEQDSREILSSAEAIAK